MSSVFSNEHMLRLGTDHLVIGRMQRYHVDDALYSNGRIDTQGLDPLGRWQEITQG
jgi:flavin reductase (DIM6/NTAB) family NADH-FMN oxidoreductase RutF